MEMASKKYEWNTKTLVKVAIFAAISAVLMIFAFPLPFAPPYMQVDFAEVATLISGFALGPVAGFGTILLKNLINLLIDGTTTGYVGELSNIIVSAALVLPAAIIYKKNHSYRGAIIGSIVGIICTTLLATLSNYFVVFPLFGVDVESFGWLASFVIPFNLVKAGLNVLVTMLIYKKISPIIKKY